MADKAAPGNLMAYLFKKDRLVQSLRLGFAGAWAHKHPLLSQCLSRVQLHCPTLAGSFTNPSLTSISDSQDTQSKFVCGPNHESIHAFNQSSTQLTDLLGVQIPTRGYVQNSAQRSFRKRLKEAYINDYKIDWQDTLCNIELFNNIRFINRYSMNLYNNYIYLTYII